MCSSDLDRLIRRERQARRSQEVVPEMTLLMPELIILDSSRPAMPPTVASENGVHPV